MAAAVGRAGRKKVNAATPAAFVLTVREPRKMRPDGAFVSLAKNSIVIRGVRPAGEAAGHLDAQRQLRGRKSGTGAAWFMLAHGPSSMPSRALP